MTEASGYFRSSRLGQIMLEGVEEIIGRSSARALLDSKPMVQFYQGEKANLEEDKEAAPLEVSAIQSSLEEMYGKSGGRGIALRAGRASFKYILHLYGNSVGLTDLDFRLLPAPARLKKGLEALMGLFTNLEVGVVEVAQAGSVWLWRSTQCPFCRQRISNEPACSFTVGLLQEFLAWNSGGKVFQVEEIECRAKGLPACVFRIDPQPLE